MFKKQYKDQTVNEPGSELLSDDISSQIESFSVEEREEILKQIDTISAGNRITITPELFEVKPLKKGGTLPLIINILGLVVIAAGFFFANRYFQAKEENMVLGETAYQSAEDSVVKELKKQAAEKLQKKQQEISRIQNELKKIDKESSSLKATMNSRIKAREKELQAQMQQELEKERARLQKAGISSAELQKKMGAFEAKKQADINASLQAFKIKSEAALKEKEKELIQAKQIAQQILDKTNREKAAIEAESQKKEAELKKQFAKEKEALTKQNSEARQKLNKLSQLQHSEQLIQDQITSSYTNIIDAMKKGKYQKAEMAIADLRTLLTDPKIKNLPTVYRRIPVENFILDSLEKEIKQTQTENITDFSTLAKNAQTLLDARANIEKGDKAVRDGKIYTAQRYYHEALSSLPKIQKAFSALQTIQNKNLEKRAAEYITLGDASMKKGKLEDAVNQYRNAAISAVETNRNILASSIHKLENALSRIQKKLSQKDALAYRKLKTDLTAKISQLQNDVTLKTSEIEKLNNALQEEQQKEAALKKQISELQTKNTALSMDLSQKKARIRTLAKELEKSSARIQHLSTRLQKADKKITKLQKELDDAVNQIVNLINS